MANYYEQKVERNVKNMGFIGGSKIFDNIIDAQSSALYVTKYAILDFVQQLLRYTW